MSSLRRPARARRIASALVALALLGIGSWWLASGPAAEVLLPGPQAKAGPVAASAPPPNRRALARSAEVAQIAAPPAAANASPPIVDFDTAPDLYKLAVDSINSADPGVLFNGLDAVNVCTIRARTRSAFEQLAAGPQTPQALAAKELLRRCGGFFTNDFAANDGLRKRYLQRLEGNAGRYRHRAAAQGSLDERFAALLATQGWPMFVGYMSEVMPGALKAQGIAADSQQAMFFGVAWMQAMCDMGRDCSDRSALYLAACAEHGRCPGSVEAELAEGMNESQKTAVRQFRERISAAVRARDLGFFGLGRGN
jgi:hypothetical protein